MKALVQREYGPPADVLRLEDVPEPTLGERDVLVRVQAAGVNAADWHLVAGLPLFVRAVGNGLRRPRRTRVGSDASGVVEAVGPAVTRVRPGDAVVAWGNGALAELMVAAEDDVSLLPAGVDAVTAAALPLAGTTALQGLRDHGHLRAGMEVLVTGASGGVGSYAVQLAFAAGATVTGTSRPVNADLVSALGAHRVLDHTREPVPGDGPYDLVLHNGGPTSVLAMRRALSPRGSLVMANGEGGRWFGPLPALLRAAALSAVSKQHLGSFMAETTRTDVEDLLGRVVAGTLRAPVERTYDLSAAAEAVAHVAEGHTRGKVVVTV